VRFYAPGDTCAKFAILAPPDNEAKWNLDADGQSLTGQVKRGTTGTAAIKLKPTGFTDVRVAGTLRVVDISFGAC
jgi:hypothetical protein